MNLLVTHLALDLPSYGMLGILSQRSPSVKIYVTATTEADKSKIKGNCIPVMIPKLSSKVVWKVIKSLRKIIKENDIDVIFSPSTTGLSNSLFASLGTKAKNIGYRGTQAKVRRTDPTYYLGVLNPRLKYMICETDDIKEYLTRFIKEDKMAVILKPFDVEWVEEACANPVKIDGIPEDAFCCINIGCHKNRPFKGLRYLLEAFYLIEDTRLHLVIIGDYDDADYEFAKKGMDEKRIHFLGFQDNVLNFIPGQDVLALPSLRDASPRVVREAMACGVPCIVTDIPGARDLIVDKVTGLLVPPGSPEKLAEALVELMNDREKTEAFGKASRERIIEHFSMPEYVDAFEKVLNSL